MVRRRRLLSADEVAEFIKGIPNLTAKWTPPNKVKRQRADQIAARIAEAFQENDVRVTRVTEE